LREVGSGTRPLRRAPNAPAPHPSLTIDQHSRFAAFDTLDMPHMGHRLRVARVATGAFAAVLTAALIVATVSGRGAGGPLMDRDQIANVLGFGIDQVSLTGHKFTADGDLFDALDLANVRTLASFDPAAIRSRFERLPWVQSAEITRIWPGQLAIRVTERQAYAIWQRTGGDYLIDRSGRVLSAIKAEANLELPRVSGEGANTQAATLLGQVERHREIASRLTSAERVGERRWSLTLAGGVTVHLPPDSEAAALAALVRDPVLLAKSHQTGTIIDLRAPARVAVRTGPPVGAPSRAAATATSGAD
jgi:cell division protein FtsQ